ncbi:hypothetical protein RvY_13133 [Ramazzottius varieornatus]|uniref:Akirin n=1 Tax=Ramazzottius varieornatus TaxID=947166 RepID=A0A1D1VVF7_RAMVA|nr:hypothetical protein RvY_13133 [Ramazzottius varieornatus]
MACVTLFQPTKRRIDAVEEGDAQNGPSQCKRVPHRDFGLSSASFGSPPRSGRLSSPFREVGTAGLSSKHFAKPPSSSSPPPLSLFSSGSVSPPRSPKSSFTSTNKSDSPDRDTRYSTKQAVEACQREIAQLDTRLKQEYEHALQEKLAEQYQSFIQFAQDQLQTNMQGPPPDTDMSYLS